MQSKNDNLKVTFYKQNRTRLGTDRELFDVLSFDEYKDNIEKIRSLKYHSDEYNALKQELPMISSAATFKYNKPRNAENAELNGILCIDIDYQDNEDIINEKGIDELKFVLINQPTVIAVSRSCGGQGIVVWHRLDDKVTKENFKEYFKELEYLYRKNLGIVVDSQCSDFTRRRYITYDEHLWVNTMYEQYSLKGLKIEENIELSKNDKYENKKYNVPASFHNYKINDSFNINNYTIDKTKNIEGFYALRRKWLATTIKRFFGDRGLNLAIDIYKAYPNTTVKQDSIDEIKRDFTYKPACVTHVANDLVELGILQINEEQHENTFNLNDDEYLSDVINKINFKIGFNLLVAGTGYGKTEVWKKLADDCDVAGMSLHNVLVCEPRNSIIVSKYIDERYEQIYGSKKFSLTPNGLVVTNYDKLINGNIARNYDFFEKFDYFVIDESHLLFSEAYRDGSIIKFIELLNNIKDKTRIIFQTATPTDEDSMFDISKENIFYVNKDIEKQTSIEYIDCYGDLLYNAEVIAKNALDNNEYDKIFIYNGTGSVISDEALKENMLEKYNVLVYHRKSQYKDIMNIFDEQHTMKLNDGLKTTDYDIFISSTAASVGIDINDECSVLVIIIGNITFEEEMQVAGRFRKCKNMMIKCLIGNGLYNDNDWIKERKRIFNAIDNVRYNNEIIDSSVVNKQTLRGINIGNARDHNTQKLKYFQIKNVVLRSSYNYKIKKYDEYGWIYNERKTSCDLFELLKNVEGFKLGETSFELKEQNEKLNYRELIVDGHKLYRLYGNKNKGWILCNKYYDDEYIEKARNYRKHINEKGEQIKEKLLNIFKNDLWKDEYYKYKDEYPVISGWIDDIAKCYKWHRKLFNLCDDETLLNNNKLLYIIMKYINYTQHDNYDWVEWLIIKLCRQNKIENMAGYAYLVWAMFARENVNKMMKISYYDSFKTLFDLFVYELNDDAFEYIKAQIEYGYEIHNNINLEKLNEEVIDIFDYEETNYDIDVLKQKLYKSHYYTTHDINMLIEHIEDADDKENIINTYDKLYGKYKCEESGKKGGKKGSPKKEVIITDKMKQSMLEKYNIKVNEKFESCSALAEHCKVKNDNITRWIKSGWVNKL